MYVMWKEKHLLADKKVLTSARVFYICNVFMSHIKVQQLLQNIIKCEPNGKKENV
jgi:hypothetical protein